MLQECWYIKDLTAQFNIDGLLLFESINAVLTNLSSYNQLYCIWCLQSTQWAIYSQSKSWNVDEFLPDFVVDVQVLLEHAVCYCSKQYELQIDSFCCDMPARLHIKCATGHSGYGGFNKCGTHGTHIKCVTFPELNAPLRTDESFVLEWSRTRNRQGHHLPAKQGIFAWCRHKCFGKSGKRKRVLGFFWA